MASDDDVPSNHNEVSGTVGGNVYQSRNMTVIQNLPAVEKPPIPFGLPAEPVVFVDREDQDRIALAAATTDNPAAVVLVVTGLVGTGTSSFACKWAHRHGRDLYPDGVLYADLAEERSNGGTAISAVLAQFLTAVGCDVPTDFGSRRERYRSYLRDKRMLVILDHVENEAEVRALCPPSAGSALLLTSHGRDRYVPGQRDIAMNRLDVDAARELVSALSAHDGAGVPESDMDELVALCDGMPAVLCLALDRMRIDPRLTVAGLTARLRSERARTGAGRRSIPDLVVGEACAALSPEAAEAYRWLAWHPGPDIAEEALSGPAERVGLTEHELVDELRARHLLEDTGPGRHRLPALVRDHLRSRNPDAEDPALELWADWYLTRARLADRTAIPDRNRVFPMTAGTVTPFADDAAAMTWLVRERHNLLALQRALSDRRRHPEVLRLGEAMWTLYIGARYLEDWLTSMRSAVDAAVAAGERAAESRFRSFYARALMDGASGAPDPEVSFTEAARQLELARDLPVDSRIGRDMRASATEFTGRLLGRRERYAEAIEWHRAAQDLFVERAADRTAPEHERRANRRGVALQHQFIGWCQLDLRDYPAAVDSLRQAEAGLAANSHYRDVVKVRAGLGEALRLAGDPRAAHAVLTEALDAIDGTTTWVRIETDVLWQLSFVARDLGMSELESTCLERLRERYSVTRNPRLDRVVTRLAALSG